MQQRKSLSVEVLTVPGCSSAKPTVERIEKVASRLKVPVKIIETVIDTREKAAERGFPGSPTVLVQGADIDRPLEGGDAPSYGLA